MLAPHEEISMSAAPDLAPEFEIDPRQLAAERLTQAEYREIVKRLGRKPNPAELGMFGVMWSEHCCYKNSRPLLKQFPTTGERILVGPGENAGVVDLGEGLRLAFKIESHNHPSAVEPFQGAATGVGGILRDIFTMGARPIALLNSLRFGDLADPKTQRLVHGVVSGISHYGNCVGVPTVGGEVYFDAAYSGNPLVNVMALGLMETAEIVKSGAAGIGNPVIYVGSTTGRDGMGGASFASAELSEESQADRPAVQVGDPFLEKSLIEACLEAFQTGAIVAAQDMGAAGLTCSTAEMAAKGGVGIDLDLDLIPARESGMIPYEYLLSESQERMLFVAQAGREQEIIDIFQRWELHAVVAGTVIAEPIVRIRHQGKIAAEIPALALAENTPIYHRESLNEPPEYVKNAQAWLVSSLPAASETGITLESGFLTWSEVLLKVLAAPTVASKAWVYRQYDHQVQNNTVAGPGAADAAVIRLRPATGEKLANSYVGVAATVDCNPRYVYLDPYHGAMAAVAEAARNLSCVGAEPLAVTDNLNFGSPEQPLGYWQLSEACRGLSQACRVLNTPVTGGNVSLYNETLDSQGNPQAIYPTPVVGMVGRVEDVRKTVGQAWQKPGDLIYLLGQPLTPNITTESISLGGSEYLATIHEQVTGKPPILDLDLEQQVQKLCREGIAQAWIQTAHDLSEGGLAVALAESCISGNFGATITLPWALSETVSRWDELLFGEGGSRILVAVAPDAQGAWETYLESQGNLPVQRIGSVTEAAELEISTTDNPALIKVRIEELRNRWANGLANQLSA